MANNSASTGLGLASVIGIVFVILKLTDNVGWSWFWVLSPWIFETGFVVAIVFTVCIIKLLHYIFGRERRDRKRDPMNVRKW